MVSSAMNNLVEPMYVRPKSQVTGADVCMNMPYPRLLKKNGMGLYISGLSGPCGSVTNKFTFCPALFSAVGDSPQPKIFSPGAKLNTGLMLRELSDPRLMKLNGGTLIWVESLSLQQRVWVSSLPFASFSTNLHG